MAVSELFDPDRWRASPAAAHGHHLPPRTSTAGIARDRVRPARGAQRVPAAHGRRAVRARSTTPGPTRRSASCCSPATARARRTAAGRSAPAATSASAAGTATSTPTARPPTARPGARRPAAHPRGAAAHPLHAQGRHRGRARLGGRRRALPARRLRPHDRERRARAVQADGCGRRLLRRRVRQRLLRPAGRAEVRPGGVLPRRRSTTPQRALRDGRGQRGRAARRARERPAIAWAADDPDGKSPTAIRMLKFAFNAVDDGMVGQQVFAGEATRLAYVTDEAVEGRDAFLEKRPPDFGGFPYAVLIAPAARACAAGDPAGPHRSRSAPRSTVGAGDPAARRAIRRIRTACPTRCRWRPPSSWRRRGSEREPKRVGAVDRRAAHLGRRDRERARRPGGVGARAARALHRRAPGDRARRWLRAASRYAIPPGPFRAEAFAAAIRRAAGRAAPLQRSRARRSCAGCSTRWRARHGGVDAVRALDALLVGGRPARGCRGGACAGCRASASCARTGRRRRRRMRLRRRAACRGSRCGSSTARCSSPGRCSRTATSATPSAPGAVFVAEPGRRWYRTGDAGDWDGERLTVTGRLDDVIVSGGEKVSLAGRRGGRAGAARDGGCGGRRARRTREWGEVPVV